MSGFTVDDSKLHFYDANTENGVGIGGKPYGGSYAFWAGKQSGNGVEKTGANDKINNAYG
jgi:hypothetical protein